MTRREKAQLWIEQENQQREARAAMLYAVKTEKVEYIDAAGKPRQIDRYLYWDTDPVTREKILNDKYRRPAGKYASGGVLADWIKDQIPDWDTIPADKFYAVVLNRNGTGKKLLEEYEMELFRIIHAVTGYEVKPVLKTPGLYELVKSDKPPTKGKMPGEMEYPACLIENCLIPIIFYAAIILIGWLIGKGCGV